MLSLHSAPKSRSRRTGLGKGAAIGAALVLVFAVLVVVGLTLENVGRTSSSGGGGASSSSALPSQTVSTVTSLPPPHSSPSSPAISSTAPASLTESSSFSSSSSSFVMPVSCHSVNGLPDPSCTPGATNPDVTQANINSTICVSGYTSSIRPNETYTERLKVQSIRAYGYADTNLSDYEEDHLVPLEVGGNPTDVRNLWAEPHYGQYNSYAKDQFENYLNAQVCSGAITLAQAQYEIATNWVKYWLASGGVARSSSSSSWTGTDSSLQRTALSSTTISGSGGLAATVSYGSNPIPRGQYQTITVGVTNSSGPLVGALVSIHVAYASGQTTKDLSCTTSASGSCSVTWLIGSTADPGTFTVNVDVEDATVTSSFQVIGS